jgi:hypothetical protein
MLNEYELRLLWASIGLRLQMFPQSDDVPTLLILQHKINTLINQEVEKRDK